MIKVYAPQMALRIIDDAVQAHGGAGVIQDFGLAASWAGIRTLRLADGPDEVHNRAIARLEFAKHAPNGMNPTFVRPERSRGALARNASWTPLDCARDERDWSMTCSSST